jgi:lipopolysaccharide transport system permease protein
MMVWQVVPGWTLVFFPLAMFGLLLFGFCLGLLVIPLGGLYGDVGRGIPIVAQFLMLLTPVVYPARTEGLAGWLAVWNPVAPLITTARASLTGQPLDQWLLAVVVTILSACVALLGLIAFRLIMPHLIARMGG